MTKIAKDLKARNHKVTLDFKLFNRPISLEKLLNFDENNIIMQQPLDQEIDICVAGTVIAKGVLTTRDGYYNIRITKIL